jgi:Lanthionine synthetase C-like protein
VSFPQAAVQRPPQESVLYESARHEPLRLRAWDEHQVRAAIARIVTDTESRYTESRYWPLHPLDRHPGNLTKEFETPLYDGACGVIWALHYLQAVGAVTLSRNYAAGLDRLLVRNRAGLGKSVERDRASFLLGDTPIRMMAFAGTPTPRRERALDALIAGNTDHPARELLLGSPGTMLAALFLFERTGKSRWADLYRLTARTLWRQLEWSSQYRCAYWTQELFGHHSMYLGGIHGFAATALPLIRGRHLLDTEEWNAWERCIDNTVQRTADRVDAHANWRIDLDRAIDAHKKPLQICHGAPGFVICLAGMPGTTLDDLLVAAGETIWSAGPLSKGSNLCHGTAGNGYALLKLYQRTLDPLWLQRARFFAMHGIAQAEEAAVRHGQWRYSLWTGDLGLAIYLRDCLRAQAQFPTLDIFQVAGIDGAA